MYILYIYTFNIHKNLHVCLKGFPSSKSYGWWKKCCTFWDAPKGLDTGIKPTFEAFFPWTVFCVSMHVNFPGYNFLITSFPEVGSWQSLQTWVVISTNPFWRPCCCFFFRREGGMIEWWWNDVSKHTHPGRVTWNLQITHLERTMIKTKPPCLSSMLIFRGVWLVFFWIWVTWAQRCEPFALFTLAGTVSGCLVSEH